MVSVQLVTLDMFKAILQKANKGERQRSILNSFRASVSKPFDLFVNSINATGC